MTLKLEEHYDHLQKEICDITKNIHKVKNKNHKTMTKIIKKLKCYSKGCHPLGDSIESNEDLALFTNINRLKFSTVTNKGKNKKNFNCYLKTYNNNISTKYKERNNTNTSYKKYHPIIYLYKNYKNNTNISNINFNCPPNKKNKNNTIDNCNVIQKERFFTHRIQRGITDEKINDTLFNKDLFDIGNNNLSNYTFNNNNNNKISKTIDFNNNFMKTFRTEINNKYKKKIIHGKINFNGSIKGNVNIYSKNKFREYYWNNECRKVNDIINDKEKEKNNIFFGKNSINSSLKNLYKKNSFKEKSNTYFRKESIQIDENSKINKSMNEIQKFNKKFSNKMPIYNKYNSINNEKIRTQNGNIIKNNNSDLDFQNIEKIKSILNSENYEQCIRKIKHISEQNEFLDKIINIYNQFNEDKIEGDNYENILLWINYLIYSKQKNQNDKYEIFCKKLMKENNITNFKIFQSFTRNLINEKKSANLFLEDIKKILSVENCIIKEKNKSKNNDN